MSNKNNTQQQPTVFLTIFYDDFKWWFQEEGGNTRNLLKQLPMQYELRFQVVHAFDTPHMSTTASLPGSTPITEDE